MLGVAPDEIPNKALDIITTIEENRKKLADLRHQLASKEFSQVLVSAQTVKNIHLLAAKLPGADVETLRDMTDRFRQKYPSGIAVLATITEDKRPVVIATITDDLVKRGLHAGELVKYVAQPLGGSGGGKPGLAQAGGKDASQLDQALSRVRQWVEEHLE